MRALDHFVNEVRGADSYNSEVQAALACILWPNRNRQREAAILILQAELPELMTLAEKRSTQQNEAQT